MPFYPSNCREVLLILSPTRKRLNYQTLEFLYILWTSFLCPSRRGVNRGSYRYSKSGEFWRRSQGNWRPHFGRAASGGALAPQPPRATGVGPEAPLVFFVEFFTLYCGSRVFFWVFSLFGEIGRLLDPKSEIEHNSDNEPETSLSEMNEVRFQNEETRMSDFKNGKKGRGKRARSKLKTRKRT